MNRQQFDNAFFQIEDPAPEKKRREKSDMRTFWAIHVPGGALVGFVACLLTSKSVFLPVWGLSTLALWALGGSSE
jgi:hypothetical protein